VNTAAHMEKDDNATYRMALFETNTNLPKADDELKLFKLQPITRDLSVRGAAYGSAGKITALEMYANNWLQAGVNNFDMETYLDSDIASMNALIPAPGSGAPGDRPREVLFIVTDGLNDETPRRTYSPMDWSGANCAAIKKRGVRIAVLYTPYLPVPGDPWFSNQVAPVLPKGLPPGLPPSTSVSPDPMALAAQQCASPDLFEPVGEDGNVALPMRTLFQRATGA
jgi:hypothetical protein